MTGIDVRAPVSPPMWTPRLARLMLRILREAQEKRDNEGQAGAA
jgi:hypothetical protein